jgi:predicted Rossmann-fold nucleotide-binding protein
LEINGFYSKLGDFLDHLVAERFVRAQHREMLQIADSPQALVDALTAWRPTVAPKWVDRAPV